MLQSLLTLLFAAVVFKQTDSKVILQHVTINTDGVTRAVETTEVENSNSYMNGRRDGL